MAWRSVVVDVAKCPSCGSDVGVPVLKAYRQAGAQREHVGTVTDCAACGTRYTALRAGGVLRFRGAGQGAARPAEAATPGGQATGGAGGFPPDMVTFDT